MPEISRFLGIVIAMHWREHPPAHLHARYGGQEIIVEIATRAVTGWFPPRALALVLEWCELHERELLINWERARKLEPLEPIPPLE